MKRILIPMIEVGGCHKSIALAIRDAIEQQHPGTYEIRVVDFPRACGARSMDRWIKSVWNIALAHPDITKRINGWMDAANRMMRSNTFTRLFYSEFVRKGMKYISAFQPDLIISTHFLCTSVAVLARKTGHLDCRVVSHVSDPFQPHCLWVNPLADELLVSSGEARDCLEKFGQSSRSMTVFPFPLSNKFFEPTARRREEILSELGLDPNRITVLASSGGEGIGGTDLYVRTLHQSGLPINLIAICGRNRRLLQEMRIMAEKSSGVLFAPLGFVHNMNELAMAADLGLVKAGPSTLFELLAMGCPVMVTHVAAQVEQGNLDFVLEQELGWDVRNRATFEELMAHLAEPGFLEPVRQRIKENPYIQSLSGGTARLADHLVSGMDAERRTRRRRSEIRLVRVRSPERRSRPERRSSPERRSRPERRIAKPKR